jgi:catechol 2,3-dioxygenase-like lactoylglutathione lyase family enzyme
VEWNKLVPELTVSNFDKSLEFYTQLLGFKLCFRRQQPEFAYLELEGVQFMLEAFHEGGWHTGRLEQPYGRGINFQIELEDISTIYERLIASKVLLFREIKDTWYDVDGVLSGQREFLVQDPDGYLLRFSQFLGEKPVRLENSCEGNVSG